MSENKATVQRYMDAYTRGDYAEVLDCLTEEIVWEFPGYFRHEGKAAFEAEINNPAFSGVPNITITRLTEENNIVVAEGEVHSTFANGDAFHAIFCDICTMQDAKIKYLLVYLTQLK